MMGLLEHAGHEVAIGLVIIYDEHDGWHEVIKVHRATWLGMISGSQSHRYRNLRQAEVNNSALRDHALHCECALHYCDETLDDGEAKAAPLLFCIAAGVCLNERLKDLMQSVEGNAH